jgi:hypothetical protein
MDDKLKTGKADRLRINVHQFYERRDWANKLGITQARLREAVKEVGPMVSAVKAYLIKRITDAERKDSI